MNDTEAKLARIKEGYDIAICGATGEVGREMLKILEQRNFPARSIHLLASGRDPGRSLEFGGKDVPVTAVADFDFSKAQLVLMAMGGGPAKEYAPKAAQAGCVIVDNSSAFRYDDAIPLVISEVNPHAINELPQRRIVANPNCSTMQLLMALKPIHNAAGIDMLSVATYQSVSGAGAAGIEELRKQATAMLSGAEIPEPKKFGDVIAFNAVPHIDDFQENGFTREEMKIVWETHKILEDDSISVSATAVRIPVFYGHGEAVHLTTREPLSADKARELMAQMPGVIVIDEHTPGGYPTQLSHAAGEDNVFVGRVRQDLNDPNGIHLWVVADNVRKGAALNAVQLVELIAVRHLS